MKTTEDALKAPDINDSFITLGAFLAWAAEDGEMYGGYTGEQALEALQHILGWDNDKMTKFVEIFVEQGYE